MKNEPTCLELFITKLAFICFGKSVYKSFADSLPMKDGERALDFGCGMGTVAYYVAKNLPGGELTCLDISERWLKACRKTLRKFDNVIFLKWENPALEKESYDVVFCHFVLHDIPDGELKKIIPVLAEALKPGGILAFREPLKNINKISVIKRLIGQVNLFLKNSRIIDIPLAGNALESVYVKE
jgi:ubiquinone/menaquinone biosynthesis C-methylase UbiE